MASEAWNEQTEEQQQQQQEEQEEPQEQDVWLGFDFGTTHSCAAVWDNRRGRPKWMRLRDIALPETFKAGRMVPSVVILAESDYSFHVPPSDETSCTNSNNNNCNSEYYFLSHREWTCQTYPENDEDDTDENKNNVCHSRTFRVCVGARALEFMDQAYTNHNNNIQNETSNSSNVHRFPTPQQVSAAMVTSVKRFMFEDNTTNTDTSDDQKSNESEPTVRRKRRRKPIHRHTDASKNSANNNSNDENRDDDSVWLVPITPLGSRRRERERDEETTVWIDPVDICAMLFWEVRNACDDYLNSRDARRKSFQLPVTTSPPITPFSNSTTTTTTTIPYRYQCRHAVLGVPAQWSRAQRNLLLEAAQRAGLESGCSSGGGTGILIESSAAALAYGLFMNSSSKKHSTNNNKNCKNDTNNSNHSSQIESNEQQEQQKQQQQQKQKQQEDDNDYNGTTKKRILVLDIGGGTTDVTIAEEEGDEQAAAAAANSTTQTMVTYGESIGGDHLDEALMEYVWKKVLQQKQQQQHNKILPPSQNQQGKDESFVSLTSHQRRLLLRQCRLAKEYLCTSSSNSQTMNPDTATAESAAGPPEPSKSSSVSLQQRQQQQHLPQSTSIVVLFQTQQQQQQQVTVSLSQTEFLHAIRPCLDRIKTVLDQALERYHKKQPQQLPKNQLYSQVVETKTNKNDSPTTRKNGNTRHNNSNHVHGIENNSSNNNNSGITNSESANVKQQQQEGSDKRRMDEIVLIGGSSLVPAIRELVRSLFPPPHLGPRELCTSVHPNSAVAQGTAIQAAIDSDSLPLHEIRSALMLDSLPYAIGVLTTKTTTSDADANNNADSTTVSTATTSSSDNYNFIEILPQDASLPAKGIATFLLADALTQKGVTIVAAERIDGPNNNKYNTIQEFHFLLHRLEREQIKRLVKQQQRQEQHDAKEENGYLQRSIEVGMAMNTNGQLMVSIFDPNDPEHVRKKRRHEKQKGVSSSSLGANNINNHHPQPSLLSYLKEELLGTTTTTNDEDADDGDDNTIGSSLFTTSEQLMLIVLLIVLATTYVAAKIAFAETLLNNANASAVDVDDNFESSFSTVLVVEKEEL